MIYDKEYKKNVQKNLKEAIKEEEKREEEYKKKIKEADKLMKARMDNPKDVYDYFLSPNPTSKEIKRAIEYAKKMENFAPRSR